MSNNISIGDRLRQERDRLLFSQSRLASIVEISRMSQVNYESGKRVPDANYLKQIAALGMDIEYIVTGNRRIPPNFYKMATSYVLNGIEMRTGFAEDVLVFVIEALAENASFHFMNDSINEDETVSIKWDMNNWIEEEYLTFLLKALFENAVLLRDIFATINAEFLINSDVNLSKLTGDKKLSLIVMLYKAFKESGKVDREIVSEAVKLVDPELAREKIIMEVEAKFGKR